MIKNSFCIYELLVKLLRPTKSLLNQQGITHCKSKVSSLMTELVKEWDIKSRK